MIFAKLEIEGIALPPFSLPVLVADHKREFSFLFMQLALGHLPCPGRSER